MACCNWTVNVAAILGCVWICWQKDVRMAFCCRLSLFSSLTLTRTLLFLFCVSLLMIDFSSKFSYLTIMVHHHKYFLLFCGCYSSQQTCNLRSCFPLHWRRNAEAYAFWIDPYNWGVLGCSCGLANGHNSLKLYFGWIQSALPPLNHQTSTATNLPFPSHYTLLFSSFHTAF